MSRRGASSAFVLHGFKAPLRDKPNEYIPNSQRTSTSSFLSQSASFSAGNMRPKSVPAGSSAMNGSIGSPTLDELELSLHDMKLQVSDLRSSLDVDFTSDKLGAEARNTRQWSSLADPDDDDAWFLHPRRRSGFSFDGASATAATDLNLHRETFPVKMGAPHVIGVPSLLPPAIPVRGRSPARTAATVVMEEVARARRSRSLERWAGDRRGARGGAARSRSQSPRPAWRPSSAKPNLSSRPPPPPPPRSRRSGARGRSDDDARLSEDDHGRRPWQGLRSSLRSPLRSLSAERSPGAASRSLTALDVSDRFVGSLSRVGVTSPYEEALRHLRRQRLRVEEELLLELKRQLELERSRGPRPKWYEMRGPQFHYEAKKNNDHLRSSAEWQRIYDHRNQLLSASHTFREGLADRL